MVPILVIKDVLEPSYNDLKFTVQSHDYVRTNLIFFFRLFSSGLLQDAECSSLFSTVGPCLR